MTELYDREGVGILYGAGTGMFVGSVITHAGGLSYSWVGAVVLLALGFSYEMHQRARIAAVSGDNEVQENE